VAARVRVLIIDCSIGPYKLVVGVLPPHKEICHDCTVLALSFTLCCSSIVAKRIPDAVYH
jgi:hypothetical protein